jgi:hypothetical protein
MTKEYFFLSFLTLQYFVEKIVTYHKYSNCDGFYSISFKTFGHLKSNLVIEDIYQTLCSALIGLIFS